MADPLALYALAKSFLVCACAGLEETTCGCPSCAAVEVGIPAWDSCCGGSGGGQLYVAIESVFPYGNFPAQQFEATAAPCQPPLAVSLVVGVLRCALSMHDNGSPPTVAEKHALARTVLEDAYAINNAISCCLAENSLACCFRYLQGTQTFVGPEGGCVGSELRLTIELLDPPCPVPE